jgi:hypothetical protein
LRSGRHPTGCFEGAGETDGLNPEPFLLKKSGHLVEMNADDLIMSNLRLTGHLIDGTTLLLEFVSRWVRRVYGLQTDDPEFWQYVEQAVCQHAGQIESGFQEQVYVADGESENVARDEWLSFYRRCLDLVVLGSLAENAKRSEMRSCPKVSRT